MYDVPMLSFTNNMKENLNECIAMAEGKSMPICKDCLKTEVESWLQKRRPRLIPALKKQEEIFFKRYREYTTHILCSVCNLKKNTCDFCFIQHIRRWIENNYPRLLAEFRLFFDFRQTFKWN